MDVIYNFLFKIIFSDNNNKVNKKSFKNKIK